MKKTLIFFLIFFNIIQYCQGQYFKNNNIAIGVSTLLGYSRPPNHITVNGEDLRGYVDGFQLNILKQVNGKKEWHKSYGMPRVGLSLQTIFMNKPDKFGVSISLLPSFQLRFLKFKNSELSGKLELGGSFVTKTFKFATNFDNRAISLPINFAVGVAAIYNHKISKHLDLNLELGYFHISNGSIMVPNGGMNIFNLKTGISYFFNETPYLLRTKSDFKLPNKNIYYTAYFAGSYRELGTFRYRKQFPTFTLHQAVMKPINKVINFGLGFDIFYDASQFLFEDTLTLVSQVKESDKILAGIGICGEINFGKLAFPLEFYKYIYDLDIVKKPVYLRFGLTYYPYKGLYTGCYFKGSNNKFNTFGSDFMEIVLGWRFRKY
jgi:hypothetical protein